jgi:hypothetical protein
MKMTHKRVEKRTIGERRGKNKKHTNQRDLKTLVLEFALEEKKCQNVAQNESEKE